MIDAFPPLALDQDQCSIDENLQVFHYSEAAEFEVFAQFTRRHRPLSQEIEDAAARSVVQRQPDGIVHSSGLVCRFSLRNHM